MQSSIASSAWQQHMCQDTSRSGPRKPTPSARNTTHPTFQRLVAVLERLQELGWVLDNGHDLLGNTAQAFNSGHLPTSKQQRSATRRAMNTCRAYCAYPTLFDSLLHQLDHLLHLLWQGFVRGDDMVEVWVLASSEPADHSRKVDLRAFKIGNRHQERPVPADGGAHVGDNRIGHKLEAEAAGGRHQ